MLKNFNLAMLAAAVADYESAWRNRDSGAMREHHNAVENAREAMVHEDGMDAKTVLAIQAALVVAAARTEGERADASRDVHVQYGQGEQYVADFITDFNG